MLTKCAKNANFTEAAFAEDQRTARFGGPFSYGSKIELLISRWNLLSNSRFIGRTDFLERKSARQREERMSIIGWIVLGLIAGFIASKIVNKQGEGIILDIVLGIVGAIVGGYLVSMFGAQGVSGVNIYSMFVAVVGAIVVLVIYHSVAGRRTV
jgi:uncharacterized membrane protein YeaQ/YmgE (transglycosylase-associated protein family)